MNRFYVYIYFRPNGSPCYVGKGSGNRWKYHFCQPRNPWLENILGTSPKGLPVVIVRDRLTEDDAFALEIALIAAIGRRDDGGPLVNMSGGGEGNRNFSAETKYKMGYWRGKIGPMYGRRHSEETKSIISLKKTGVSHHTEICEKISAALRNRDPSVRAAVNAKNTGRKRTPEQCERISAAKRGKKFSAEAWERIRAGQIAGRKRRAQSGNPEGF